MGFGSGDSDGHVKCIFSQFQFGSLPCWMIWPLPTFNSLAEAARFSIMPATGGKTVFAGSQTLTLLISDSCLFCILILLLCQTQLEWQWKATFLSHQQVPTIVPFVFSERFWTSTWEKIHEKFPPQKLRDFFPNSRYGHFQLCSHFYNHCLIYKCQHTWFSFIH